MIPPFNDSGYLPPFTGENSTISTQASPYKATMLELVTQFATSPERQVILRGLLDYRAALRAIGIVDGYQWLDGSFCSDIERLETRAPRDIDVVTYACRPAHAKSSDELRRLANANLPLFITQLTKATYHVDAYFIDMEMKPHQLVERASYWHGVFGHQRVTSLWKGMVRVELSCDDAAALQHLNDFAAAPQNPQTEGAGSTSDLNEALIGEGAANA